LPSRSPRPSRTCTGRTLCTAMSRQVLLYPFARSPQQKLYPQKTCSSTATKSLKWQTLALPAKCRRSSGPTTTPSAGQSSLRRPRSCFAWTMTSVLISLAMVAARFVFFFFTCGFNVTSLGLVLCELISRKQPSTSVFKRVIPGFGIEGYSFFISPRTLLDNLTAL